MDTKLIILLAPVVFTAIWLAIFYNRSRARKHNGLCHYCGCKLYPGEYTFIEAADKAIATHACLKCAEKPKRIAWWVKLIFLWAFLNAVVLRVDYLQ